MKTRTLSPIHRLFHRAWLGVSALTLLAAACTTTPTPSDDDDDGDRGGGGSMSQSAPDAPRILSFTSTPNSMGGPLSEDDPEETITFFLVVTDPDGIGDVIGGSLMDQTTDVTYASFTTSAEEGSYTATVSWSDVTRTLPVSFSDQEVRSFRARVFDQSGAWAEATVSVTLHCHGDAGCGTACVDLQSDSDHCGTCGRECTGGTSCGLGACQTQLCSFGNGTTCDNICGAQGLACGTCNFGPGPRVGEGYPQNNACILYSGDLPTENIETCDQALFQYESASCCCNEP